MLKTKIDGKEYQIPTFWSDVNYLNFALAQNQIPVLEKIWHYSTIPLDILSNFTLTQLNNVIEVIQFTEQLPEFFESPDIKVQIAEEAFWKLKEARTAMANRNEWLAAIDICKTYLDVDISVMNVTKGGGYAAFFLNS